jgi:hypothetical protein
MNSRQKRTIAAVFTEPTPASIAWSDIESLFRSLGATITEANGSRVRIAFGENRAVFHRPHPSPATDRGAVRSVRRLLTEAGFTPEEDES